MFTPAFTTPSPTPGPTTTSAPGRCECLNGGRCYVATEPRQCSCPQDTTGQLCETSKCMVASWHGNAFRITSPLWGESTAWVSNAVIFHLLLTWRRCWTNPFLLCMVYPINMATVLLCLVLLWLPTGGFVWCLPIFFKVGIWLDWFTVCNAGFDRHWISACRLWQHYLWFRDVGRWVFHYDVIMWSCGYICMRRLLSKRTTLLQMSLWL